jgi:hypothetical protein
MTTRKYNFKDNYKNKLSSQLIDNSNTSENSNVLSNLFHVFFICKSQHCSMCNQCIIMNIMLLSDMLWKYILYG